MDAAIETIIQRHLHALAVEIGPRPTGSEANRRAEEYNAVERVSVAGLVEVTAFVAGILEAGQP